MTTVTDRLTVVLFSFAAFLAVLAVLAHQLPVFGRSDSRPSPVVRKIYRTTVIETLVGSAGPTGVTRSVSGSSSSSSATQPAPTTRVS
ncbi:MAG: hypothetical protein ACXVS6_12270 [Solirubrobacteraceae bacterium]